ncbi:MAG: hypothetical protein QOK28_2175, partial [Actinomycetota bacterium]
MRVFVNAVGHGAPTGTTVQDEAEIGVDTLLWLPVARTVNVLQLDNIVVGQAKSVALHSQAVVIGVPPEIDGDLRDYPEALDYLHRRVEKAPIYVARIVDGVPRLDLERGESVFEKDANVLEVVRRADMESLLRRGGAELPAHDTLHYDGPNGRHYRAFIRPGFALRGLDEIDRVSFWLAEHLKGCTQIIVDHWALIGLASNLHDYLRRLGLAEYSAPGRVECVESYDEDYNNLHGRISRAFKGDTGDKTGVIISVNSSGALARRLVSVAREITSETAVVSLSQTAGDCEYAVPSLCGLGPEFRAMAADDCDACREDHSTIVPIEHDTYLLALAAFVRPTSIRIPAAAAGKDFFSRYAGTGAACVHRTHADGRHHAFYIDVAAILDHAEFRQRLGALLSRLSDARIEVVVAPRHPVAERLARIVADQLGVRHVCVDEGALGSCDPDDQKMLREASRICLVDDVVITGGRVYRFRNRLIDLKKAQGAPGEFELFCLVGVARPPDLSTLRG